MANVQKHKNTSLCYVAHKDSSYYKVVDSEGTLREYNTKDWDMEVTFTRKIKPFPNGSLVLSLVADRTELFQKINGKWYYLFLNDKNDSWSDYDDKLSDADIRQDKGRLWKVLHEPEPDN